MRNKKKTVLRLLFAFLTAFMLTSAYIHIIKPKTAKKPEFEIINSFSTSYTMQDGSKGRDTDLNVIVYRNYNDEDLYKRVKEEHNRINGEPTELKISLYKDFIKDNEPYRIVIIDYINNTEEIIK